MRVSAQDTDQVAAALVELILRVLDGLETAFTLAPVLMPAPDARRPRR